MTRTMTRAGRNLQLNETRAFFDEAARGWSARFEPRAEMAPRKAAFAAALGPRLRPGAAVLDYGCGSGDITRHLAEAGYAMTGCDISVPMIEAARAHAPTIAWVALDGAAPAAALPFASASFDGAIASSVMEYVPEADAALREIARVLRPGGWLFMTVPDMRDPHRHRERLLRAATTIPPLFALLSRSRWAEGARYLRISINRREPETWRADLAAAGLAPQPAPPHTGPLLMLTAQKAAS